MSEARRNHPTPTGKATLAFLLIATAMFAFTSAAASAAAPTFVTSFDGSETPAGTMKPTRSAVDESTGDLYVIAGTNDAINRFSASGAYLGRLLGSATTATSFGFGGTDDDVAVDNSGGPTQGYVYVVGEQGGGPGRVSAFDADGNFRWQVAGSVDMCGVAVDGSGNLYTADYTDGVQRRSVADGAAIGAPQPVTANSCQIAFDNAGALYLREWDSGAIVKYPTLGGSPALVNAGPNYDIATDSSNGDVYIAHNNQNIAVYDSSGAAVSGTPFGSGQFASVAVDGSHGGIFLSDLGDETVKIWQRSGGAGAQPYVRSGSSAGATNTTAVVAGKVNPAGVATTCNFQYVSATQFALDGFASASSQACASSPGSGSAEAEVGATLSGLTASTAYRYRLIATNSNGTTNGSVASFETAAPTHHLTVTVQGAGSVDADTGAITDCSATAGTCTGTYTEGDSVTLTATAKPGATFSGWAGDCSGTAPCTVTVDGDLSVSASFELLDGDGDGVPDNSDACPAVSGSEANGCPPLDSDGDGVPDKADACPTRAGTQADGCPPPLLVTPTQPGPGPGAGDGVAKAAYESCLKSSTKAFRKSKSAALKKRGKAKSKALGRAKHQRAKREAACKKSYAAASAPAA